MLSSNTCVTISIESARVPSEKQMLIAEFSHRDIGISIQDLALPMFPAIVGIRDFEIFYSSSLFEERMSEISPLEIIDASFEFVSFWSPYSYSK